MNNNWKAFAVVVDKDKKICGVITDGNIRRNLVKGVDLDSPVSKIMTRKFKSVRPETPRNEVLDLMKAQIIRQAPVIDRQGKLCGIHFLEELIGAYSKPNWALILAGGMGTRLRPITNSIPKPMVKIAGRPILERLILHLIGHGIKKFFISANYLSDVIERHFQNGKAYGCRIEYLKEKTPLGTGGPLSLLSPGIRTPIIVVNGDIVTDVDITSMLNDHHKSKSVVTVAVKPYAWEIPVGVIVTRGKKVTKIREKPIVNYLVNAGIYVMNPAVKRFVPKNQNYPITDLLSKLIASGHKVSSFLISTDWQSVEGPRDLLFANGIF